jgi:hypothetical protein
MSTSVIGIRKPDEKWEKMKKIWDACKKADIEPPHEVAVFFDFEEPDDNGIKVWLSCGNDAICKEWEDEGCSGYELAIEDLPENITHIRFYNSW